VIFNGLLNLCQPLNPLLFYDPAQVVVIWCGFQLLQQLQLHDAVMPAAQQSLERLAVFDQFGLHRVLSGPAGTAFRLVANLLHSDSKLVPGTFIT